MEYSEDPIAIPLPTSTLGVHAAFGQLPFEEHASLFEAVAALGYGAIWTNEIDRWDGFSLLHVAASTRVPLLGSAIATVPTRGPAVLSMQASALAEATGGRFVLGIGPGSPVTVGQWNGLPYEAPVRRMSATVKFLRSLFRGERASSAQLAVRGFRLASPPRSYIPIFLSASRIAMLRLAYCQADGVLLSWVSPEDVAALRRATRAWSADRELDRPLAVMASILVYLADDVITARQQLKRQMMPSLAVATYRAAQAELGRGERLTPAWEAWDAGQRDRAPLLIPDSVVDDLAVVGDPDSAAARLRQYGAAGVEHIAVAVAGTDGSAAAIREALSFVMGAWKRGESADADSHPISFQDSTS